MPLWSSLSRRSMSTIMFRQHSCYVNIQDLHRQLIQACSTLINNKTKVMFQLAHDHFMIRVMNNSIFEYLNFKSIHTLSPDQMTDQHRAQQLLSTFVSTAHTVGRHVVT